MVDVLDSQVQTRVLIMARRHGWELPAHGFQVPYSRPPSPIDQLEIQNVGFIYEGTIDVLFSFLSTEM